MTFDPREELASVGVDPALIDSLVEQRLANYAALTGATEKLNKAYPELQSQEMLDFVGKNPQLQQSIGQLAQSSPVEALEYCALKYRQAGGRAPAQRTYQPPAQEQPRESSDHYGRRFLGANDPQASQADKMAYIKGRLKQVITDDFLNQ